MAPSFPVEKGWCATAQPDAGLPRAAPGKGSKEKALSKKCRQDVQEQCQKGKQASASMAAVGTSLVVMAFIKAKMVSGMLSNKIVAAKELPRGADVAGE